MMLALQATLRLWRGSTAECIELSEEARAIFRRLSDHFGETQVMAPLSRALVATGRIADANRVVEECRAVALPFGLEGYSATIAAGVAVHVGDGARAVREAVLAGEALGDSREAGYDAQVTLALALLQLGRVDEAVEVLAELPPAEAGRPYDLAVTALVHAADGRPDEDQAAAVALDAGDVVAQAIVRVAMAESAAGRDDPDAVAWQSQAVESFAGMGIDPTGWFTALRLAGRAVELAP
jgi:hypothetical protein